MVGLAKREEELYVPELPEPVRAVAPRRRRSSSCSRCATRRTASRCRATGAAAPARLLASRLDDLRGVGPRRKRALIERFGSLEGIRAAPLAELQGVARTGDRRAHLHRDPCGAGAAAGAGQPLE